MSGSMTRLEVAHAIESIVDGTAGDRDFDDLTSMHGRDHFINEVARRCSELWDARGEPTWAVDMLRLARMLRDASEVSGQQGAAVPVLIDDVLPRVQDGALLQASVDWTTGFARIDLCPRANPDQVVRFEATGVSRLSCERIGTWGRRAAIKAVRADHGEDEDTLRVDMESGEVLAVTAEFISTRLVLAR